MWPVASLTSPPSAESRITSLILKIFEANGQLLAAGDRLVAPLGLTSARWQVLGAIDAGSEQLSVADVARRLHVSRQAVQRITNELADAEILTFADNPRHKRSPLVRFTDRGRTVYEDALALQLPWAEALAAGLAPAQIEAAVDTLEHLLKQLAD